MPPSQKPSRTIRMLCERRHYRRQLCLGICLCQHWSSVGWQRIITCGPVREEMQPSDTVPCECVCANTTSFEVQNRWRTELSPLLTILDVSPMKNSGPHLEAFCTAGDLKCCRTASMYRQTSFTAYGYMVISSTGLRDSWDRTRDGQDAMSGNPGARIRLSLVCRTMFLSTVPMLLFQGPENPENAWILLDCAGNPANSARLCLRVAAPARR